MPERDFVKVGGDFSEEKEKRNRFLGSVSGALGGTRTPDLLVRSQSLYPAELQAHMLFESASSIYHIAKGLSTLF